MLIKNSRFYEINKESHKYLFMNEDPEMPTTDMFKQLLTDHLTVRISTQACCVLTCITCSYPV